jgi:hypothetical protein
VGRPSLPREHGTMRGFNQHRRNGEKPCDACNAVRRAAKQLEQYRQRNDGKCAPGLGWPLLPGEAAARG